MEKHPLHLKNQELQLSEDVQDAVEKQERLTEEKVSNDPSERIDAYMDRLESIFFNKDEKVRERNLEILKPKIYEALLVKPNNFPESYFELQKRIAREQGHGDVSITPEMRVQMIETAIEDQKHSLDAWIEYLTSEDAVYPTWFKYYVWTQIIKLSQFDKERGEYKKRTDSTVAPFPDIYREPLAQICDAYEKVKASNKSLGDTEVKELFSRKFSTIYAELTQKSLATAIENKEEVKGEWVKYEQGDSGAAEKLFLSLEGKGTGWCTAGRSTAETQVNSGDFYVYYSDDKNGNPTQPRLAIRMNGKDKISEVRGVLPHQNVEPIMNGVLEKKLSEFGDKADAYYKKSKDMQRLTEIEKDSLKGASLSKDDLIFLYEVDSPIEGFGYEKDPRIAELLRDRNMEEDMLIILECTKDQIAHRSNEITEKTKAYIGRLEPGIFQKFPKTLEHIYTSFPKGKIRIENVEVGGSPVQLKVEMIEGGVSISEKAQEIMTRPFEIAGSNQENIRLVRLKVDDLNLPINNTGYSNNPDILHAAFSLGLWICPKITGLSYRLIYRNQPPGESLIIVSEEIKAEHYGSYFFKIENRGDGLRLDTIDSYFDSNDVKDQSLVFCLREYKT